MTIVNDHYEAARIAAAENGMPYGVPPIPVRHIASLQDQHFFAKRNRQLNELAAIFRVTEPDETRRDSLAQLSRHEYTSINEINGYVSQYLYYFMFFENPFAAEVAKMFLVKQ